MDALATRVQELVDNEFQERVHLEFDLARLELVEAHRAQQQKDTPAAPVTPVTPVTPARSWRLARSSSCARQAAPGTGWSPGTSHAARSAARRTRPAHCALPHD